MLKRLVKYGNSNAIILDKALLELLNIQEGALLKIKTDGTSLIITPHERKSEIELESPTVTHEETLRRASLDTMFRKYYSLNLDQEQRAVLMHKVKSLEEEFNAFMKKAMENSSCAQELHALARKAKDENRFLSAEYVKEHQAIINRYIPELAALQEKMIKLDRLYSTAPKAPSIEQAQALTSGFTQLFVKHASAMQKFARVIESIDYQHEAQLLAEKYQADKNSELHLEAITQLKYKYVPELRELDEEIKAIAAHYTS